MAALWNRAGHYIFALWFLSIFLSFYFDCFKSFFRKEDISKYLLQAYEGFYM